MKGTKTTIAIVLVLAACIFLAIFGIKVMPRLSKRALFQEMTGMSYDFSQVLYEYSFAWEDSETSLIIQGTDAQKEIAEQEWTRLPMDEDLEQLVFEGPWHINGDYFQPLFPKITDGAFLFIDLSSEEAESETSSVGEGTSTPYKGDFAVAVFDFSDNKIYFTVQRR